ncbi:SRPBCC family protein [Alkalicoccus chagannorensis]|uniref:SRPBCC family protein n=1 Tax=Alkalicoccus chagannorensis TaxID=427072 RepID=UPI0004273387|nr:SRPBCC domain-containing protein [Alkalicoccus chagannorensis]
MSPAPVIIQETIQLPFSRDHVWSYLAEAPGLGRWFMPGTLQQDEQPFFLFHAPYGDTACWVLERERPARFRFEWGIQGDIVTFQLNGIQGGTELQLAHQVPASTTEGPSLEALREGWRHLIQQELPRVMKEDEQEKGSGP